MEMNREVIQILRFPEVSNSHDILSQLTPLDSQVYSFCLSAIINNEPSAMFHDIQNKLDQLGLGGGTIQDIYKSIYHLLHMDLELKIHSDYYNDHNSICVSKGALLNGFTVFDMMSPLGYIDGIVAFRGIPLIVHLMYQHRLIETVPSDFKPLTWQEAVSAMWHYHVNGKR